MGRPAEVDDETASTTLDRELSAVLSDLDQLRLKLDRLREAAEKRSSEVRLKIRPPK